MLPLVNPTIARVDRLQDGNFLGSPSYLSVPRSSVVTIVDSHMLDTEVVLYANSSNLVLKEICCTVPAALLQYM